MLSGNFTREAIVLVTNPSDENNYYPLLSDLFLD
jgi:hypothetical protein